MEIKSSDFTVNGGLRNDEYGKSHWPDHLHFSIPKEQVLSLISQLALCFELYNTNDEYKDYTHIPLDFMGKLDYDIKE